MRRTIRPLIAALVLATTAVGCAGSMPGSLVELGDVKGIVEAPRGPDLTRPDATVSAKRAR